MRSLTPTPLPPAQATARALAQVAVRLLGGPGSGNFGHAGRPGEVGGSDQEGGAAASGPKPGKQKHETGTIQKALAMKADGKSYSAIQKELGVHPSTLIYHASKAAKAEASITEILKSTPTAAKAVKAEGQAKMEYYWKKNGETGKYEKTLTTYGKEKKAEADELSAKQSHAQANMPNPNPSWDHIEESLPKYGDYPGHVKVVTDDKGTYEYTWAHGPESAEYSWEKTYEMHPDGKGGSVHYYRETKSTSTDTDEWGVTTDGWTKMSVNTPGKGQVWTDLDGTGKGYPGTGISKLKESVSKFENTASTDSGMKVVSSKSLSDVAKQYGYEWKEKTEGPSAGKYAYFKDGVQVSAPHAEGDSEAAAASMHYGTGPQVEKVFQEAKDWPAASDVTRSMGSSTPAALAASSAEWSNKLNDQEKGALSSYVGSDYNNINSALRAGKSTTKSEAITAAINKAATPPPPELVWRGLSSQGGKQFIEKLSVGDTVQMKGFQSTSINPQFAANWHGKHDTSGTPFLEIRPAKGAYLGKHGLSGEREYLLPHNATYTVKGLAKVKLEQSGSYVSVLQLEMHP